MKRSAHEEITENRRISTAAMVRHEAFVSSLSHGMLGVCFAPTKDMGREEGIVLRRPAGWEGVASSCAGFKAASTRVGTGRAEGRSPSACFCHSPFPKGGSRGIGLGVKVEVGTARPSAGFPPVRGSAMLIGGA